MLAELTRAAETRHPWTRGHAARVADLAVEVAEALAWEAAQVETVRLGAILHDVGKVLLRPEVLGKPGPLTALEQAEVRTHPLAGARLVERHAAAQIAVPCVLYHHERWDGTGYPTRRAGADVPAEARLIGIADAFDAMTSVRPYRARMSVDAALAELVRCAGTQFDPVLADACVATWSAQARIAV